MFRRMIAALWPLIGVMMLVGVLLSSLSAEASSMAGQCSDCHTMHNSEQGQAVARRGIGGTVSTSPLPNLLRYDCIACHALGGDKMIVSHTGGSSIPQVYHGDPVGDLAAGNFAYISGTKGGGASDRKGHNVVSLVGKDSSLAYAPGAEALDRGSSHTSEITSARMSCAGPGGCHGLRRHEVFGGALSSIEAMAGSHHGEGAYFGNKDRYYRFLSGVKGMPNPDPDGRWQNKSSTSHNEYYGIGPLIAVDGCGSSFGGIGCHAAELGDAVVAHYSISNFCGTCHLNYHTLKIDNNYQGIGSKNSSPFLRHPSDYVIPNRDEYAAHKVFNVTAPVARPASVFDGLTGPLDTVSPGTDMVMCLSCHVAHASPYDGMLRFDYSQMVAGGNTDRVGCLACHTTKGVPVADR